MNGIAFLWFMALVAAGIIWLIPAWQKIGRGLIIVWQRIDRWWKENRS